MYQYKRLPQFWEMKLSTKLRWKILHLHGLRVALHAEQQVGKVLVVLVEQVCCARYVERREEIGSAKRRRSREEIERVEREKKGGAERIESERETVDINHHGLI